MICQGRWISRRSWLSSTPARLSFTLKHITLKQQYSSVGLYVASWVVHDWLPQDSLETAVLSVIQRLIHLVPPIRSLPIRTCDCQSLITNHYLGYRAITSILIKSGLSITVSGPSFSSITFADTLQENSLAFDILACHIIVNCGWSKAAEASRCLEDNMHFTMIWYCGGCHGRWSFRGRLYGVKSSATQWH